MDSNKDNMLYKDLSYKIMSSVFEVHNTLGPGFLEKIYENALIAELLLRGILAEAQKPLVVQYKGIEVGCYCADIIVNGQILLELKAVETLNKAHEAQVLNYLKATGLELGILINFGKERIESKRFVL
ncbi:GxxExxY protein [Trichlorobacter lovleyi]|uniref:GxxExxY protein n=1 Tax=Trichlorobacter lovleyi TaxID=313985 RepID=UPI003D0F7184